MSLGEVLQYAQCQEGHPRQHEQVHSRIKRSRGCITAKNPLFGLSERVRLTTPDLLIGTTDSTRPRNKPDGVSKYGRDEQGVQSQRTDKKCNHNGWNHHQRHETYEVRQPVHRPHDMPELSPSQEVER